MTNSKLKTQKMVKLLKKENQDFEWYPTTDEMIACVKRDIKHSYRFFEGDEIKKSILDIGCGDGRVLNGLTTGLKYGIEISVPLLNILSDDIFIVGTDFYDQQLLDKNVDIIFSNPIYSDFENWAVKIIKEGNASILYLIVPIRWKKSSKIKNALHYRGARVEILQTCNFGDGDRATMFEPLVNILRITLSNKDIQLKNGVQSVCMEVDPFELWFKENFKIGEKLKEKNEKTKETNKDKKINKTKLIESKCLVSALELLYNAELKKLMDNYASLGDLDPELMDILNIELSSIRGALRLKIQNTKTLYWTELFDNLKVITNKLTKKTRTEMLSVLLANTSVDFTEANVRAVVIWVIKNSNKYFDEQLIDVFKMMTERANIINYKSNLKTFGKDLWKYNNKPKTDLSKYKLDHRIVISGIGGTNNDDNLLDFDAKTFLEDLMIVATNLGFDTANECDLISGFNWKSGKKNVIEFKDHETGENEPLMEVKAFLCGNLHIKFNQNFIIKLNVEFGRLKGWIKSKKEASEELDITQAQADAGFASNFLLSCKDTILLIESTKTTQNTST